MKNLYICRLFAIFALLLPITQPTFCQWVRQSGPASYINCFSKAPWGEIFSGTRNGLYSTTNSGEDWVYRNFGGSVKNITFDSTGGIYVHLHDVGVWRSLDTTKTWKYLNIKFLALEYSKKGYMVGDGNKMYFSTDKGDTWLLKTTFQPGDDAQSLSISKEGYITVTTGLGQVYETFDQTGNWFTLSYLPLTYYGVQFADNSGNIFIGSQKTIDVISRQFDWVQIYNQKNFPQWIADGTVSFRGITKDISGQIYATSRIGVISTTDFGKSWKLLNKGINDTNATLTGIISDENNNIFIGSSEDAKNQDKRGRGIYHSTNKGEFWSKENSGLNLINVLSILSVNPSLLLVGTDDGVYKYSSDRNNYIPVTSGLPRRSIVTSMVHTGSRVILSCDKTDAYYSINDGDSWTRLDSNIEASTYTFKDSLGNVFVCSSGIYISKDSGISFEKNSNVPSNETFTRSCINPNDNIIYIGTASGKIFTSTNNGIDWNMLASSFDSAIVDIACDHLGNLFTISSNTLYKSSNNGQSWEMAKYTENYQSLVPFRIMVNRSNDILVLTNTGALYRSRDSGSKWSLLFYSITESKMLSAEFIAGGDYILSGSDGCGLYRPYLPTNSINDWNTHNINPNDLSIDYQLPSNTLVIESKNLIPTETTLKIFSVTGQLLMESNYSLINRIDVDLSFLKSGMYQGIITNSNGFRSAKVLVTK